MKHMGFCEGISKIPTFVLQKFQVPEIFTCEKFSPSFWEFLYIWIFLESDAFGNFLMLPVGAPYMYINNSNVKISQIWKFPKKAITLFGVLWGPSGVPTQMTVIFLPYQKRKFCSKYGKMDILVYIFYFQKTGQKKNNSRQIGS